MRLIFWLAAVVALIMAMLVVVVWGPASVSVTVAERALERWSDSAKPGEAEISAVCASLDTAVAVHPLNAHYWYLLGKCQLWQEYVVPSDQHEGWNQAEASFQRSVLLRPSWPDTWVELAKLEAARGRFGGKFEGYVANAVQRGPYKPSVTLALVKLGLANWRNGQSGLPGYTVAAIERGLHSSLREKIYHTAEPYHAGPLVCALWWRDHRNGWGPCGKKPPPFARAAEPTS